MCNKDKCYFCNTSDTKPKSIWTDRSLCECCWHHTFPGRAVYDYAFNLDPIRQGNDDE